MSEEATDAPPQQDGAGGGEGEPELFSVSVTGNGVQLTRTVDQGTALDLISLVLGGRTAPGAPTHTPRNPPGGDTATQRRTSPTGETDNVSNPQATVGEFIDECEARRNPEKITAIGHYLQVRLGQGTFTRDEVKSQFKPAGEKVPGNYARDFNDAIAQRWIAVDSDDKSRYYVTTTGNTAINEKFGKPIRRTPTRRKKATTKSDNGSSASNGDSKDLDA